VSNARKTVVATVSPNSIFNEQMTAINADLDTIPKDGDHSMSGSDGIVGLQKLRYGFLSCHGS
jgi:hypothetical protein